MTNEDIRMKIAEIKGWTFVDAKKFIGARDKSGLCAFEECPNWPVNIADAMGLIIEMQSEPYIQAIQITRVPAIGKRWVMWVGANITETGDTLPMAICLAYIQWKESQK